MAPDGADVRRRRNLVHAEQEQLLLVGEPRVVHQHVERVAGVDCGVYVTLYFEIRLSADIRTHTLSL